MVSIWIFPFAVIGFIISFYIFFKKSRQESLVCFTGQDCNLVVDSKYNKIFGFPNEILGMLYYLLVVGFIILGLEGVTEVANFSLSLILVFIATVAAGFSIFLIYVQALVLKHWCEYCIATAITTIAIFIIELFHLYG
ncbi:MAG: hypothetical protein CMI53_02380 [Parcubacteria group bacterium]|jgi:uncharacterized membrane protein|nr:hypothetical protein [Parcubacteria group bacterium]|tara:strand:- start:297 stop:710 length:414 start_codon:yes stop_codon:yes gene_type:complete